MKTVFGLALLSIVVYLFVQMAPTLFPEVKVEVDVLLREMATAEQEQNLLQMAQNEALSANLSGLAAAAASELRAQQRAQTLIERTLPVGLFSISVIANVTVLLLAWKLVVAIVASNQNDLGLPNYVIYPQQTPVVTPSSSNVHYHAPGPSRVRRQG